MRTYTDGQGRDWDVVVGRESWGALYALFVPRAPHHALPVRQTLLGAEDAASAEIELDSMDGDAIERAFRASREKES